MAPRPGYRWGMEQKPKFRIDLPCSIDMLVDAVLAEANDGEGIEEKYIRRQHGPLVLTARCMAHRLIPMVQEGALMAECCVAVGASKENFRSWQKRNPAVRAVWVLARSISQAWWEGKATYSLDTKGFQARTHDTVVKTHFRGIEEGDYDTRKLMEQTVRDGDKADEQRLTPQELQERIERLLQLQEDRKAARASAAEKQPDNGS